MSFRSQNQSNKFSKQNLVKCGVIALIVVGLVMAYAPLLTRAQEGPKPKAVKLLDTGHLTANQSAVMFTRGGTSPVVVAPGSIVEAQGGDQVDVDARGEATITFGDLSQVRVFRESQLAISTTLNTDNVPPVFSLGLLVGSIFGVVAPESDLKTKVQTVEIVMPNEAKITVTGTQFWVHYEPQQRRSWVAVQRGKVKVTSGKSRIEKEVGEGQQIWTEGDAGEFVDPVPANREAIGKLFPSIESLTNNALSEDSILRAQPQQPYGAFNVLSARAFAYVNQTACYTSFKVGAAINVRGIGTLDYAWERADGTRSEVKRLPFLPPETFKTEVVYYDVDVNQTDAGWVRLVILTPRGVGTSSNDGEPTSSPIPTPDVKQLSANTIGYFYSNVIRYQAGYTTVCPITPYPVTITPTPTPTRRPIPRPVVRAQVGCPRSVPVVASISSSRAGVVRYRWVINGRAGAVRTIRFGGAGTKVVSAGVNLARLGRVTVRLSVLTPSAFASQRSFSLSCR